MYLYLMAEKKAVESVDLMAVSRVVAMVETMVDVWVDSKALSTADLLAAEKVVERVVLMAAS